ncbi:MAG: amidophosphoribosyltransferase [Cryomorphaceae bacterium]|nr:amidophosphoribosyltransferase [Cryomorphaceae bacterium]
MSDPIKHECGIAMLRLRKPLEHYREKHGSYFYGINKMYLLMEKQHNRGQDGAGFASIKLDMPPGSRYISRYRSVDAKPIQDIFTHITKRIEGILKEYPHHLDEVPWLKENLPYLGEVYLGHLRYGTYGGNSIENCHPFLRQNNWVSRNLILAGNFNMTNVRDLFDQLVDYGQHPKELADTVTIMEKIGHFLDASNEKLYRKFRKEGYSKREISPLIAENLPIEKILRKSSKKWDGGYAMAGMFGTGDSFVLRDPSGIRPAYYYCDDDVVVVCSERPVIQTAFDVPFDSIKEVTPGHALIIRKNGDVYEAPIVPQLERKSCSFERIYFSRGNDRDIYQERINLGRFIVPQVMEAIDYDLDKTVFSFIPNTAEVSYLGMMKGVEDHLDQRKSEQIAALNNPTQPEILKVLNQRARWDKVAWKDAKLRTFITEDSGRDSLVSHVYDITQSILKEGDQLVVMDDSIVRGTTLRQSILRILDRLKPVKIVVASSAPQIRYPDCYGIDMARMGDFIAFQAAIHLLKKYGRESVITETYEKCKASTMNENPENHVKDIYAPFTAVEISMAISELLTPKDLNAKVEIVYNSIENLHAACPHNLGDWYFTGDYPTPGGNRVVNRAFMNYVEGNPARAY